MVDFEVTVETLGNVQPYPNASRLDVEQIGGNVQPYPNADRLDVGRIGGCHGVLPAGTPCVATEKLHGTMGSITGFLGADREAHPWPATPAWVASKTYSRKNSACERAMRAAALAIVWAGLTGCGSGPQTRPDGPVSMTPRSEPVPATPLSEADIRRRLAGQPSLGQVSPQEAWLTGWTGQGVTIGIEDDPVDLTHPEFEGRADWEKSWPVYGYLNFQAHCAGRVPACEVTDVRSEEGVREAVREIVESGGWPSEDDRRFIRHVGGGATGDVWYEVPAVAEADPTPGALAGRKRWHGTQVAAIAAGEHSGIAPGARVASIAFASGTDMTVVDGVSQANVRPRRFNAEVDEAGAATTTRARRKALDAFWANDMRRRYTGVDIVNRSFGPPIDTVTELEENEREWLARWSALERHMPKTWRLMMQEDRVERDKTLFVYAAGNNGRLPHPDAETRQAYHHRALRGLHLTVAGVDSDGSLNRNATPCGPLPADWVASRDGRHFCLVAPWTVKVVLPEGVAGTPQDESGASVSAPVVTGALAVVLHRFRGQITPREAGLRVVNTADNTGSYSVPATHGAGLLNVEAAIRPMGVLSTGLAGLRADVRHTRLRTPSAWGNLEGRLRGVEIAGFDAANAPFWMEAGTLVQRGGGHEVSPVPALDADRDDESPGAAAGFAWREARGTALAPRGMRLELGAKGGAPFVEGARVVNGAGLALRPEDGRGFGAGFTAERDAWLGGGSDGAFGEGVDGSMTWLRHEWQWTLDSDGRWRIGTDATLANGRPRYGSSTMFSAGSALYTSARVTAERRTEDAVTRLSLSQPLRAETGEGRFRLPIGRTPEGEHVYAEHRVGLPPEGREVRMALERVQRWGPGTLGLKAGWAHEAGHTPGESEWLVGAAWGMEW